MNLPAHIRWFPFVLAALAWLAGMFLDILEIDAAQYASMSQEMLRRGDWLHFTDQGKDYLDKPPLIFWASGLSFLSLGFSNFAYHLPSLLFCFLSVWSLRELGTLLVNARTGYLAALIFATAEGTFLMNQDVKTDMYLVGAVSFTVWMLAAFSRSGKWKYLLGAGLGLALGMLAKGPMGIVAPGIAFGADLLARRDWKAIFRPAWLLLFPIVALLLTPYCIGLYQQFDAHPEKLVNGEYNVSGIRFFLWTQSFGRVTGESPWQNDAGPFFLVHNFLWLFLPWVLFLIPALVQSLYTFFRNGLRVQEGSEILSTAGFVLLFIAVSTSRYKLPHYIFIVWPFAALLTAGWLDRMLDRERPRAWGTGMRWLGWIVLPAAIAFGMWTFPSLRGGLSLLIFLPVLAYAWQARSGSPLLRFVLVPAAVFAALNVWINFAWYPAAFEYQSTAHAGRYVHAHQIPEDRYYAHMVSGRANDVYAQMHVRGFQNGADIQPELARGPLWIYTDPAGLKEIRDRGMQAEILQEWDHFSPNRLTLPFLNPATRSQKVQKRYLLHLRPAH